MSVNVSESIDKAFSQLKERGRWKNVEIVDIHWQDPEEWRKALLSDGMSDEEVEFRLANYASCWICFETDGGFGGESSEYETREFDLGRFERDFRNYLLPFFGGDDSSFPEELDLTAGEMEFVTPAYYERFPSESDESDDQAEIPENSAEWERPKIASRQSLSVWSIDGEVFVIASSCEEAIDIAKSTEDVADADSCSVRQLSIAELDQMEFIEDGWHQVKRTFLAEVGRLLLDGKWAPGLMATREF